MPLPFSREDFFVEHGSVLKIPTFGLPCPTTIFTAGLFLLAALAVLELPESQTSSANAVVPLHRPVMR